MLVDSPISRLRGLPERTFFLFGPRGTGKSTWLRQVLPKATRIDLLDEALYQELLAHPGRLAQMLLRERSGAWVIIDEVQRLPHLLNEVHRFIEERALKFALSGSSTRKLKRAGVNLLGGRADLLAMHPFVPQELGTLFDLDDALAFGMLPVVLASTQPQKALASYAQLYLREEIQAEALARNLPAFARFLGVAALFHGQTINVSSLARDAQTQRTTVNDYLQILEDTLLAWRLPAWDAGLRVRERRHPKLYWVDPGVVRAVKKQLGDVVNEERGPLFEGLIATTLREYLERVDGNPELSYWASATTEVDFIFRYAKGIFAIEAKSSTQLRPEDLTGLRALAGLPRLVRRILVYRGSRSLITEDGIEVLSFADWVQALNEKSLHHSRH